MENSARHKLALFDVCQTLVDVTTITDFVDNFLLSSKYNPQPRGRWTHYLWKLGKRLRLVGGSEYRKHLISTFHGYTPSDVEVIAERYLVRLKKTVHTAVLNELQNAKKEGYKVYLVSAGLAPYLAPFASWLSVGLVASDLETVGGVYTGRLKGVDCIGEGKVEKLKRELPDPSLVDWSSSRAYGDSLSDVPMLLSVGEPIAVHPDQALRQYAQTCGWRIILP